MHEDVPCSDHLRPRHFGMALTEIGGESPHRFADDLDMAQHPVLYQLVAIKGIATAPGVFLDIRDCVLDVQQTLSIISHSGTDSRRTRSRIRSRKPGTV